MAEIVLIKKEGCLIPYDDAALQFVAKMKEGELTHADYKKVRNYIFHKKYFSLINFAFDCWETSPGLIYKEHAAEKNIDRFRKDIIILAGFYNVVVGINDDARLEAHSISFASMDELEFERLYDATISVILKRVLKTYTREDLDKVINKLMGYT